MRVAFFDSADTVINVAFFSDLTNINLPDFYSSGVSSHKVLSDGETAIIGEKGTATILKPYDKWVWNESQARYEAPVPQPAPNTDAVNYNWNDETGTWEEVDITKKA